MSFSLPVFPLDWETILAGEGPLKDVFAAFNMETILLYIGSWLYFIAHSWWFPWIFYVGFLYLALRIIMKLIPALRIEVVAGPEEMEQDETDL